MKITKQTKEYRYTYQFDKVLDELNIVTFDDFKKELFDNDGYCDSKLMLINRDFETPSLSFKQRILTVLLVPILLTIIMPLKWLITGNYHFNKNNKYSKFLLNLLGEK